MCFCTFPGEPDTELSAPAAIRQSGSDADHLPLPSLLPLLCGSPVDRCIHCLEVRGRDFKYLETAKYIQQFYEPQINCTFLFAKSCLPITESPKTGPRSRFVYSARFHRLTPSEQCGPFRGLSNTFSVVGVWIDDLKAFPGSQWVIWLYEHVIRSEIFYFLVTLMIL